MGVLVVATFGLVPGQSQTTFGFEVLASTRNRAKRSSPTGGVRIGLRGFGGGSGCGGFLSVASGDVARVGVLF